MSDTRIAVIGAWHNAFITATCLADLGHHITLVNHGDKPWVTFPKLDIHEPGLDDLIGKAFEARRLDYANLSDQYKTDTINPVNIVWLAIDTPLRDDDSPDVEPLILALIQCKTQFPKATLVIIGSQIPVGFCQDTEKQLGIPVACVPENMQLGNGINGFMLPDRLVIGATSKTTGDAVAELLSVGVAHDD